MRKFGRIMTTIVLVGIVYMLVLVIMPFMSDLASTANTTMAATSNVSNYPGGQEVVLIAPWILWFAPGVIGMVVVFLILKSP